MQIERPARTERRNLNEGRIGQRKRVKQIERNITPKNSSRSYLQNQPAVDLLVPGALPLLEVVRLVQSLEKGTSSRMMAE
jgi:hypothetical protein